MKYAAISKILAVLLFIVSLFMIPSVIMAAYLNEAGVLRAFAIVIGVIWAITIIINIIFRKPKIEFNLSPKDGLIIVSLGWILCSFFGAFPLYLSGFEPSYIDAFFQVVSGFTTTGATVIGKMRSIPKPLMFWLSMTHWIGGMGILVFTVGVLPKLGISGFQIMKAESPGPIKGRITTRTSQSATRLYIIYFVITVILFLLLILCGMNAFDSIVHTFGVVGTGGFSNQNESVGAYSGYAIPIVMSIFMALCSTNFSHYNSVAKGRFKEVLQDEEFRVFYGIVIFSILAIGIDLYFTGYGSVGKSLVDSGFQVTSIISTSGFSNTDFNLWPEFSKFILFLLMISGGSAGATSGGVKIIRIIILFKLIRRGIEKVVHPRAIVPIKVNGKVLTEDIVDGVSAYCGLYMVIFLLSSLIVTTSGQDIVTSMTSVATMLSNVGPGLGGVGPMSNFDFYGSGYKLLFCLLMLLGRLEFFTMLALIIPRSKK